MNASLQLQSLCHTVLVLIKLTKFAVALQILLIDFLTLFHHLLLNLRTLYIVWNLVRRRVTRRLTRLKLYATLLNIAKYFKTLRCGCGAVAFIFSIYLKPALYHLSASITSSLSMSMLKHCNHTNVKN